MNILARRLKPHLFLRLFLFLLLIFSIPLGVFAGNDTTLLPIDSLSSEESSNTSPVSSEEENLLSSPKSSSSLLHADFSNIYQEEIVIGEPVVMYQLITLTHDGEDDYQELFSLEDYPTAIPLAYLTDALEIELYVAGELISTTAQAELSFQPGETKELYVYYTYVPVEQTLVCETKTIGDMLPAQAQVTSTTVGLAAQLYQLCTLTLSHDTTISYYDVTVVLDDIDTAKITSIYYVQGDQYLDLEDNSIFIPKP